MSLLNQAISQVRAGQPIQYENLTVHPLLGRQLLDKDYLTLDEALAARTAQVTEVSEAGSVPALLFRNHGTKPVFLLDGEELVGAKQNRILNITILAAANHDTVIPVSCVEAGRWRRSSSEFKSAPRAQYAQSRARKAYAVSEDIAVNCLRRSNQGEVWNDIDAKLGNLGSTSHTGAVEAAFLDHEERLAEFVARLETSDLQVGAVFSIDDEVTGVELFDSQQTCRALMPKIVRSYALDAIDPKYRGLQIVSSPGSVSDFLEQVGAARTHEDPAVGLGTDLRIDNASGISGGALVNDQRVVHLCAFRLGRPQSSRSHGLPL